MNVEYKFPVVEIFDSIEGEGKRAGTFATFIRFAGCPLNCRWCDTRYALNTKDASEHLIQDEIMGRIRHYPWRRVTLTGGEPMVHLLLPLVQELAKEGYEINIETSGALPLFERRPRNTFYSMDWKCPGSHARSLPANLWKLQSEDVLKFVVSGREDLEEVRRIQQAYKEQEAQMPQIYMSPVFGEIEPREIVEFMKGNGMKEARLQIQLHKVVWPPETRGV